VVYDKHNTTTGGKAVIDDKPRFRVVRVNDFWAVFDDREDTGFVMRNTGFQASVGWENANLIVNTLNKSLQPDVEVVKYSGWVPRLQLFQPQV
jgi:hypothetical protein